MIFKYLTTLGRTLLKKSDTFSEIVKVYLHFELLSRFSLTNCVKLSVDQSEVKKSQQFFVFAKDFWD